LIDSLIELTKIFGKDILKSVLVVFTFENTVVHIARKRAVEKMCKDRRLPYIYFETNSLTHAVSEALLNDQFTSYAKKLRSLPKFKMQEVDSYYLKEQKTNDYNRKYEKNPFIHRREDSILFEDNDHRQYSLDKFLKDISAAISAATEFGLGIGRGFIYFLVCVMLVVVVGIICIGAWGKNGILPLAIFTLMVIIYVYFD
jgi:hypothetical protein